jgi:hypothetical protein
MSKILSLNTTTSNTAKALLIGTSLSVSLFFLYKRFVSHLSHDWYSCPLSVKLQTFVAEVETSGGEDPVHRNTDGWVRGVDTTGAESERHVQSHQTDAQ